MAEPATSGMRRCPRGPSRGLGYRRPGWAPPAGEGRGPGHWRTDRAGQSLGRRREPGDLKARGPARDCGRPASGPGGLAAWRPCRGRSPAAGSSLGAGGHAGLEGDAPMDVWGVGSGVGISVLGLRGVQGRGAWGLLFSGLRLLPAQL